MWYEFTAYNSETLHGWTDDPEVADAVVQRLNRDREINKYQAYEMGELSPEEDARLSVGTVQCNEDTRAYECPICCLLTPDPEGEGWTQADQDTWFCPDHS
jgi:hypothetical protein